MNKKLTKLLAVCMLSVTMVACSSTESKESEEVAAEYTPKDITLVTTTSLEDTGFLEETLVDFEEENNVDIKVVAKGTGEALELGKRKDADILFVHAKSKEEEFINEGYGDSRHEIMYNYFVLVGPKDGEHNEAISEMSAEDAFKYIKENNLEFVSRGDKSGTHTKELAIWEKSGEENAFDNYNEVGKGMASTLQMASEMGAYTLTDIGTYLATKDNLDLGLVKDADESLKNVYSMVTINGLEEGTKEVTDKLVEYYESDEVQKQIKEFGQAEYNESLFYTFE